MSAFGSCARPRIGTKGRSGHGQLRARQQTPGPSRLFGGFGRMWGVERCGSWSKFGPSSCYSAAMGWNCSGRISGKWLALLPVAAGGKGEPKKRANGITASGTMRRTNRSDTWPHQPAGQSSGNTLANGGPSKHGSSKLEPTDERAALIQLYRAEKLSVGNGSFRLAQVSAKCSVVGRFIGAAAVCSTAEACLPAGGRSPLKLDQQRAGLLHRRGHIVA